MGVGGDAPIRSCPVMTYRAIEREDATMEVYISVRELVGGADCESTHD